MITENFDNYKTGGSHKGFNIEVVGTDTVIGNTNMLQESITLDEALCSDNNLKFGACEASQFSVQVANIFEDFVDKELNVSVTMDGITTKYGTFKVDSDKPTADRVWRVLTCYDKMKDIINANVIEWYRGLTFPMTQKAYRDSFFTYLGIEQVEVSLINDDFMVQGGFTATDTLSGKTIITSICEFNGVFGHINREGKFDYVSLSSANAVECPPYENNSVTYEDYETDFITRVTMRGTASDVGTSVGEDGNEYIITNNPIIYGTEGTDELITSLTRLLNKIGSIFYRPYSVGKTIGNPCVELGDAITVNTRHQTINSYVIKRTLTGIQALRDKYSATGSKVYPAEVNSIREEISRTQGKMNILTRTVDETKSQIVAIQTDLTDNYLTSTQTQTLINQSASQIQATVTQTITAELPDLVDEVTGGLSDRITVVESSYTQLSNEIVLKVKADGTVAQVALGSSAENGSNVLIKGDNIQLDGDVTITDGFRLTAGIIQSENYVANESGMKITLSDGLLDTANFKLTADGKMSSTGGTIGGFTITTSSLYNGMSSLNNTTNNGVYIGTNGIALGKGNFKVTKEGALTIGNLTINEGLIKFYSAYIDKNVKFCDLTIASEVVQTNIYDLSGTKRVIIASVSDGSTYSDAVNVVSRLNVSSATTIKSSLTANGNMLISKSNPTLNFTNTGLTLNKSSTNGVTETTYCLINFRDSANVRTGRIYNYGNTSGAVVTQITARNEKTDGSYVENALNIIARKDGTLDYSVSNASKFRNAISAAAASHTHSYLPLSGGTITGTLEIKGFLKGSLDSSLICTVGTDVRSVNTSNSAFKPMVASAFTVSSSTLVKENIKDITDEEALKILEVRPINYDYKEAFGGEKNRVGVVAEEVYKLLPKVVSMPEAFKEEDFDEGKGISQPIPSVDYAKFTPYLIKMIQIQQKEIDELKKSIT